MQNIVNLIKTNKRVALVVVLLIVAFIGYILFTSNPTGFRISKTDPKLGDVATLTSFIKVEFSEPIVEDSVKIPNQATVKRYEVENQSIKFYLNGLDKGKKQTITIESVISAKTGAKLNNEKLSYKPKEVPWDRIPREQQVARLDEQDKKADTTRDPVLDYMPYTTPDYKITAVVDQTVKLHALITPASADASETGVVDPRTLAQYKSAVVKYLQSIKIDPVKYDLSFSVRNPATLNEEPLAN